MKTSIASYIASEMDAKLKGEEFSSLFKSPKYASKDSEEKEDCSMADDMNNASAGDHKAPSPESLYGVSPAADGKVSVDESAAEDDNDAEDADDENDADDDSDDDDVSNALDASLASLLNASAALDSAGLEKTASLVLDLAGFVVTAKKKAKDSKKKKKDSKKDSKKKKIKSICQR